MLLNTIDLLFDKTVLERVEDSLKEVRCAVVRRNQYSKNKIPVGIRGQRLAARIDTEMINSIKPSNLTNPTSWKSD